MISMNHHNLYIFRMKAEQKQQAKNESSRGSNTSSRKSSSVSVKAESSVPSTIFEAASETIVSNTSSESVHHQIVDYSALAAADDESIPMEEA